MALEARGCGRLQTHAAAACLRCLPLMRAWQALQRLAGMLLCWCIMPWLRQGAAGLFSRLLFSRQWLLVLPLCALTSLIALPAGAARWEQLADTVFQHLNTDHGLPQGTGTALVEDRDGFLWVGTQGGLARWDGYRFHSYLSNPYDSNSLPDGFVSCMVVDAAGRLWIGTNGGGLARYVREKDRFQTIGAGARGLSHVGVTALSMDDAGGLWVGTEGGLDHLDAQQHVTAQAPWVRQLPDLRIRALLRSRDGVLWVGTRKGLLRVDAAGQAQLIHFPVAAGTALGIGSLLQTADGKIWVGSQNNGAFWIDAAQQVHALALPKEVGLEWVNAMVEPAPGVLWLSSNGQGIVALEGPNQTVRKIRNDVRLPASLADNNIWSMLRDRSGMVWVGNNRGLSYHATRQNAVFSLFGVAGRTDGLSEGDVQAIVPAGDGRIWMVLGTKTLAVLDPASGKIDYPPRADTPVFALAPGPQGSVLVGVDGALFRSTGSGTAMQELRLPAPGDTPSRSLPLKTLENLFDGAGVLLADDKVIWLGGGNGLWRLELDAKGQIVDWRAEVAGQLTDHRVTVIERTPGGLLWVGTEFGLNLVDPQAHTVERILPNRIDPAALPYGNVTTLLLDRQQRLWVGSAGGGITLMEGRTKDGKPRFRRFGLEQGLPHMIVTKLVQDSQGNIWGSTEDGLLRVDGRTLQVQALRRADGVAISSYWANVGAITRNDELLFGGAGGMTVVDIKNLGQTRYQPPVVVSDLRIGGKPQPVGLYNGPDAATLVIPPSGNTLALEFAALDYSAPERNRYGYRLDGYDQDWIESDATRRIANYANLPPGEYYLQFRGSNRHGMFAAQPRTLTLQVLPAWYQTWWWRVLVLLGSMALIGSLVQARTGYLRKRQLELKSQVRIRTIELRQKQNELLHANEELGQTADTLRLMGDVGRDITANLEQTAVHEALYHHIAGLLDVIGMTIYVVNSAHQTLDCCFAREDGKDQPHPQIALDSPTSIAARAVRERHEVLIDNDQQENAPSHVPGTLVLRTALFAPLIVGQRVLGAMSVQSVHAHAYGERERLIFRTVCAYGAIALSNAQALDALHDVQRQLMTQEKMASLGGLVSGVAHEVNTPLGNTLIAISGAIDIWQRQKQLLGSTSVSLVQLQQMTDEGLEYAELAHLTARRVVEMVNSFKAIAINSGIDQYYNVKLDQYLPEVVALVRTALEHGGRVIRIEVEPGLVVRLVPEALTEALARILSNVLSHAFADGESGQVVVRARRDGDAHVLIEVADNGHGIAPQDLPKVFDPFFTTRSGVASHVGLGLHIAFNHITQRLHGSISIASEPGLGTTVSIRLPLGF